jgi:hypothetical protein
MARLGCVGGFGSMAPLRGAGGGFAADRLEQGSKSSTALGEKSKMGPRRPHF